MRTGGPLTTQARDGDRSHAANTFTTEGLDFCFASNG